MWYRDMEISLQVGLSRESGQCHVVTFVRPQTLKSGAEIDNDDGHACLKLPGLKISR